MNYLVAFLCVLSFASLVLWADAERRYRRDVRYLEEYHLRCREHWERVLRETFEEKDERTDRCD